MNKRLMQLIGYYELSTRKFEQKISVSNGVIAKVLKNNTTIRSDILSKIADTFQDLNMRWLLTGNGEMLCYRDSPSQSITYQKIISDLRSDLTVANQTIGQLRQQLADLKGKASSPSATTAGAAM